MSTNLRQRLDELASTFTAGVLQAVRSASIEDVLAESGRAPRVARAALAAVGVPTARAGRRASGRLARRSAADIGEVIDRIVSLVKTAPKGMRAEEIRVSLGMQAKEMPRPLKEAVSAGRLGKSGQKRATTYFAKGGGGASAAKPRGAKKAKAGRPRKAAKKAKAK
jgi:hypothetical protein